MTIAQRFMLVATPPPRRGSPSDITTIIWSDESLPLATPTRVQVILQDHRRSRRVQPLADAIRPYARRPQRLFGAYR